MPRHSRTQESLEALLDAIVDGELKAGDDLPPEGDLATRFAVSRNTIREAVRMLQTQGVIVQVPGARHRIAPVGEWTGLEAVVRSARSEGERQRASLQLVEMRMMIEAGAAALAATRRTDAHLDQLEKALERMRRGHERTDVHDFVAGDLAFHDVLFDAADNRILVATMRPLNAMLASTRFETSSVERIRVNAIREHVGVLEAVREGSAEAAHAAMSSHMVQTRDDLVTYVHRN